MYRAECDPPWSFETWRDLARRALRARAAPEAIEWTSGQGGLLQAAALPEGEGAIARVPRGFEPFARLTLQHSDPERHALLYRVLWRLVQGEARLLERGTDTDVHRALDMQKAVRRDRHKMKAFVRFREIEDEGSVRYVAWFEPDHFIVDDLAPFFVRRFTGMRWSILTPYRGAHWNGDALTFGDGAHRDDAPAADALEDVWRSYYANTFNPARPNLRMMRQEMPQKYWKNLPEAQLLPSLMQAAGGRVREMAERVPEPPRKYIPAPAPRIPAEGGLAALRDAARACRACPLWEPATQTVFGEGPDDAQVMVVGEQPGDKEDLSGHPFVGPSGALFDRAIAELGLDRARFYVTNAVKHFKFERSGKTRLHCNPGAMERRACLPWLQREIRLVKPRVIVCLGATASQAVMGTGFRLMDERGRWQDLSDGRRVLPTVHPSWVLRQRDTAAREAAYALFRDDLAQLGEIVAVEPLES